MESGIKTKEVAVGQVLDEFQKHLNKLYLMLKGSNKENCFTICTTLVIVLLK